MLFEGPSGKLEGELNTVTGARVAAVLCHPHPQMGGTMHDAVLGAVESALLSLEITSLKFNYRGVGASEGSYDNGRGETEDVFAAVHWLRENTDAERLILAGYSFGGVMALQAAEQTRPDALLLVAPAVAMAADLAKPELPGLVVLADQDQFVDVTETRNWFETGKPLQIATIDTDHFFFGQHEAIAAAISHQAEMLTGGSD